MAWHRALLHSVVLSFLLIAAIPGALSDAKAGVLATDRIVAPLPPNAPQSRLSPTVNGVDPDAPVWVRYELIAVSAAARPEGAVVLDAAFEAIPVNITKARVVFSPNELRIQKGDAALAAKLDEQLGGRSAENLQGDLGTELGTAYAALQRGEGSVLHGTKTVLYPATGQRELVLLASIVRTDDLQPLVVSVTIGQGEPPAEDPLEVTQARDKVVAGLIGLLGALAYFWFRRSR